MLLPHVRAPLCVREALLSVLRRPFRSLLVLQAIIWGSAAAIFPHAIFKGSREAGLTRSGEFASDRVIVTSPSGTVFDTWEEIDALKNNNQGIQFITGLSPQVHNSNLFVGTDTHNLDARRMVTAAGRNFTKDEIDQGAPVCILEAKAAERLFSRTNG